MFDVLENSASLAITSISSRYPALITPILKTASASRNTPGRHNCKLHVIFEAAPSFAAKTASPL